MQVTAQPGWVEETGQVAGAEVGNQRRWQVAGPEHQETRAGGRDWQVAGTWDGS